MEVSLKQIFNQGLDHYQSRHGLSLDQHRAAQAIMACQSDVLGHEEWLCREDGHIERAYHSCRHRSCPRCNSGLTHDWLEKLQTRLLSCQHYHIILTLPHELNGLWYYNRAWCTDRLFKAATETIRQLLSDERYLGAEVGILASLHTWGRTLSFHPHVHLLVTGGGMNAGGEWIEAKRDFLLPVGVIKAKFRGKWLSWLNAAYAAGEITLPDGWRERDWKKVLTRIARKPWNVRIQGNYAHGKGVAIYLSRYVRGGPIKDSRLIGAGDGTVSFRYQDHQDGKDKVMGISVENFISRVLSHVPVKGRHHVRYYGLYLPGAQDKRNLARETLGDAKETACEVKQKERHCPDCGRPMFHYKSTRGNFSYIKGIESYRGFGGPVQQDVQANISTWPEKKTKPPEIPDFYFSGSMSLN